MYTRICVNVKQFANLPKEIDLFSKLGRWVHKVEYESIPFSCFHCKKVGHWAKEFPSKPMPKMAWKKKNETKGVDLVVPLSLDLTPCMDEMNNIPCV